MKTILPFLLWEIVWKHRLVFPALGLLFGLGITVALAAGASAEDPPWWLNSARGIMFGAFLTSLLLSVAPFTLMESHPGWRMNSMITRWFALPVRTAVLVFAPLLTAVVVVAGVFLGWVPLLTRALGPGLDSRYFLSVLVLGVVALHALAWTVPRRPGQYWAIAGLLVPATLLLAIVPQDQPDTAAWRQHGPARFALASVALGAFALWAASRNRRGDWPGHLPLEEFWLKLRDGGAPRGGFRSAAHALFHSEARGALRFLGLSWLLLASVVLSLAWLSLSRRAPGQVANAEVLVYAAVHLLPFLGVLWLAGWGLVLGNEPASGFRTRLSAYRATLPLTPSQRAGVRLAALGAGWLLVWIPLALLAQGVLPNIHGVWDYDDVEAIRSAMAWRMVLSAHLLVGALPLLLWGRLEGFPNVLLAGMAAWAGGWFLSGFLAVKDPTTMHWVVAGALGALKAALAGTALVHGLRARLFGVRFAFALFAAWGAIAGLVLMLGATPHPDQGWRLLGWMLLLPLTRPLLCPLAVARNQCR